MPEQIVCRFCGGDPRIGRPLRDWSSDAPPRIQWVCGKCYADRTFELQRGLRPPVWQAEPWIVFRHEDGTFFLCDSERPWRTANRYCLETCPGCGQEFFRTTYGDRRYCTPICRLEDRSGTHKSPHEVTCATCDRTFEASRPDARYCSDACRMRAYRERQRD